MEPRIPTHSIHSLPKPTRKNVNPIQTTSFNQLLERQIHNTNQLKVSKHAQHRMDMRGIEFSAEKWLTIQDKVKEAKQKGVKDSLVITNNAALIVSAQNDTVITVLNRDEAQSQIFTNINGTILID
ncbi:TIGR02530 family flagellar biosynthesis protein [Alkalihalobacillus deserti]|uniref:TIGR02530 family flagellar biosynthesis protein n=1 Tax=Alkalihalobacillus deserti TaxID=2879466 RepID=UPI001D141F63|nr:TIGR02530 family flagellar biosynthesis protein [Alkalihalobacillus deserti]